MINNMKDVLRSKLLVKRANLSSSYQRYASGEIVKRCYEIIDSNNIKSLALYHPIKNEVDPLPIAEYCWHKSIMVALPIRAGFAKWQPGDLLELNKYGIMQPESNEEISPQLVITPLVGFTRAGERLGYGGGFYDRVFANMQSVLKIGISYKMQELNSIPVEQHDVKLDLIITESEVIVPYE